MAHPKRKQSKARRDKRRTHYKLGSKTLFKDSKSGEVSQYHRVNMDTGMYKGVQVIPKSENGTS